MKEAEIFESWANRIVEGTWALPETPEQQDELKMLMSQPLVAGADGMNATEQLYGLVGDDELFDIIGEIAVDPDANIWDDERVQNRLEELGVYMVTPAEPAVAAETPPVAEGRPEDLPGKDYDRPGDVKRKQPSGEHNPYPYSPEEDEEHFREIFRKKREAANKQQGVAEDQLDEIGDTPAGRAALGAVEKRADDIRAAWSANPKSGYSSTPKDVSKATSATIAASNRLHGFGPDRMRQDTVMARDAFRQKQGMSEGHQAPAPGWYVTHELRSGDPDIVKGPFASQQQAQMWMNGNIPDADDPSERYEITQMFEGDNLATFEEAQCNQTMEGEYCPEHGMAECGNYGMYESELARIKSLALFK